MESLGTGVNWADWCGGELGQDQRDSLGGQRQGHWTGQQVTLVLGPWQGEGPAVGTLGTVGTQHCCQPLSAPTQMCGTPGSSWRRARTSPWSPHLNPVPSLSRTCCSQGALTM